MPRLGPLEIGLILVIILVVFGAGKLPQVGKSMGQAIKEFRKSKEGEDEVAQVKTTKVVDGEVKSEKKS